MSGLTPYGSGQVPGRAAPQGGGRSRPGRGRAALTGLACAALLSASAGAAEIAVEVPSGQPVTLIEILMEETEQGSLARFRYLAPGIAGETAPDFDTVQADLAYLCERHVIPTLEETGQSAVRAVLSLSDRKVPFGVADAEATQMFEAYRLENGACIWEMF